MAALDGLGEEQATAAARGESLLKRRRPASPRTPPHAAAGLEANGTSRKFVD